MVYKIKIHYDACNDRFFRNAEYFFGMLKSNERNIRISRTRSNVFKYLK